MIEEPKNVLEQIRSDPNFLMIFVGAVIWFIGFYISILGGLFLTAGFVLVSFATALNALKRAIEVAWPGLLLGGLMHVIGLYLNQIPWLPLIGNILIVCGSVAILYFAIPLAIQKGELPILTQLQKVLESQKKPRKKGREKQDSDSPRSEEDETK